MSTSWILPSFAAAALLLAACGSEEDTSQRLALESASDETSDQPPGVDEAVAAPLEGPSDAELLALPLPSDQPECLEGPDNFLTAFDVELGSVLVSDVRVGPRDVLPLQESGWPRRTIGYELELGSIEWASPDFDPSDRVVYGESLMRDQNDGSVVLTSQYLPDVDDVANSSEALLSLFSFADGEWLVRSVATRADGAVDFGPCGPVVSEQMQQIAGVVGSADEFDLVVEWAQNIGDTDRYLDAFDQALDAEYVDFLETSFAEADPATRSVHPRELPPSLAGQWEVYPVWIELDVPADQTIVIRTRTGSSSAIVAPSDGDGAIDVLPVFVFPGDDEVQIVLDSFPPAGGEPFLTVPIGEVDSGLVVTGSITDPRYQTLGSEEAAQKAAVQTYDELRTLLLL